MKVVLKLIAYMIVLSLLIKVNTEDRMIMLGEVRSYGANIIATHDAAVIRRDLQAEGFIVFDEVRGLAEFRDSLIINLGLNPDLSPTNHAIFSGPIKIAALFFVGDDKVPANGNGSPIYPYEFAKNITYRGETITVRETLFGPSIISMIEAPLNVEGDPIILKRAVYRYLDKEL